MTGRKAGVVGLVAVLAAAAVLLILIFGPGNSPDGADTHGSLPAEVEVCGEELPLPQSLPFPEAPANARDWRPAVSGIVRDATDGKGIHNACVRVAGLSAGGIEHVSCTTDDEGRYRTDMADFTPVVIDVIAAGYLPARAHLRDLSISDVRRDFDLQPFSTIEGSVRDTDGNALPGSSVTLFLPVQVAAFLSDLHGPGFEMKRVAHAGKDGMYRFRNVPPGEGYRLAAHSAGHVPEMKEKVNVPPGKKSVIDFTLGAGGTLTGVVRLQDPENAEFTRVTAFTAEWLSKEDLPGSDDFHVEIHGDERVKLISSRSSAALDTSGRFSLTSLPPGPVSVEVSISRPGYSERTYFNGKMAAGDNRDMGVLEPAAKGLIHGTVTGPRGEAIEGTQVSVSAEGPLPAMKCATDSEGRYIIKGMGNGRFRISVHDPSGDYIGAEKIIAGETVECNFTLEKNPVAVSPDKDGVIEMTILNAPPAGKDEVFVALLDDSGNQIQPAVKGAADSYTISAAPGVHLIEIAWGSRHYVTDAVQVRSGEVSKVSIDGRKFTEGHIIKGIVYDSQTGSPAGGATISVTRGRDEFSRFAFVTAASAADGSFALKGLAPNTAEIVVLEHPGYRRLEVELVSGPPESVTPAELQLEQK